MAYFKDTNVFIEGNNILRAPQKEAYLALKESFKINNNHKIVVLPTGTGKTGVIAIAPYGISDGRVLVITPGNVIKHGISNAFDTRSLLNFWQSKKIILNENDLPKVAMYSGFSSSKTKPKKIKELESKNIVITNIQKVVSSNSNQALTKILPKDFFDLIIIDESHHSAADSYIEALEYFTASKIIKLTGTPYRSDNKELTGDTVYEYELADAIRNGLIKNITSSIISTEKLTFEVKGKVISKEEALDLMDTEGVSKMVAYSIDCSKSIVDQSIKILNEKRSHGSHINHNIIAVACSIEHAQQIKQLYSERGLSSAYVSSNRSKESTKIIEEYKLGKYDVVVHVGMLGEGFDHPNISIAAIFRPYRNTGPYAQFIGRALRYIQDGDSIDNIAHVIHHSDLYLDDLWAYYTGQQKKAIQKSIIEREYTTMERSSLSGKAIAEGQVTETVKDYLQDLPASLEHTDAIEKKVSAQKNEYSKMRAAFIDQGLAIETVNVMMEALRDKHNKDITDSIEEHRADLILNDLRTAHQNNIVNSIDNLFTETQMDPKGNELPLSTKNIFLKNTDSNVAYVTKSINASLKRSLNNTGIEEWLDIDFERAKKLLPELIVVLKSKIEEILKE